MEQSGGWQKRGRASLIADHGCDRDDAVRVRKVVAIRQRKEGVVQVHLQNPGNLPEEDILNAGLGGCGPGDRVPVTAQAGSDPDDIDLGNRLLIYRPDRHPWLRGRHHKLSVLEEKGPSRLNLRVPPGDQTCT